MFGEAPGYDQLGLSQCADANADVLTVVFAIYTGSAFAYSSVMAWLLLFSPTIGPCRRISLVLVSRSLEGVHEPQCDSLARTFPPHAFEPGDRALPSCC